MELDQLLAYLNPDEPASKVIEEIQKLPRQDFQHAQRLAEYEPEGHAVMDKTKRKDRMVTVDIPGTYDEYTGKPKTQQVPEPVTRISVALQKLITKRRNMFVTGAGVELECNPEGEQEERFLKMLLKVAEDVKLDFKYGPLHHAMLSEGESAALFYLEDVEAAYWGKLGKATTTKRPRLVILQPSLGDTFYPVFNGHRDMVAFGRSYESGETSYFDLYTDANVYKYAKGEQSWALLSSELHGFDRIPVAYFPQQRREWADVQPAIERLEKLLSNHGDTNDYNGSPIILAKGAIKSFAGKGESGKILELENDANAEYLSWDSAPESIKLEIDNLREIIFSVSRTPDISFGTLLNVGAVSGVALKLMFLDAHAAAKEQQDGAYGEGVQRMINILKSGIAGVDQTLKPVQGMSIKAKFSAYLPVNEKEELENLRTEVETLIQALNANLINQEQAIAKMPEPLRITDARDVAQAVAEKTEKEVTLNF